MLDRTPAVPRFGDFNHLKRHRSCLLWEEASLEEVIGRGRYAQVHRAGGAAVKVLRLSGCTRRARLQAYREHVVGLLQSLLLADRVTPHLPWHFGVTFGGAPEHAVRLHMEMFERTLEEAGTDVLTTPQAWVELAFQVLHACAALTCIFGVTHNDVYPRNILLRRCGPQTVSYEVLRTRIWYRASFLSALTDFGIASGELLGAPLAPEVASTKGLPSASREALRAPEPRAFKLPQQHILCYALRPGARDFYTVFGWLTFGASGLPPPPLSVRVWALSATRQLDVAEAVGEAKPTDGAELPRCLLRFFSEEVLESFSLGGWLVQATGVEVEGEAIAGFSLRLESRPLLLKRAVEVMRKAQALDETWAG